MRILHTEASCGWGGQEIRILEEARGLIERGHSVSVACPAQARLYTEAPRFGVPAVALPIDRKNWNAFRALRRHLRDGAFDVVNSHSSTDSWLAALACATLSEPPALVRTRHVSVPVRPNALNRWLYGRAACHIVTTGQSLRQQLIDGLQLAPQRVTSVPTGIDTQRFIAAERDAALQALGLDSRCKYIGIVATLRSWKGHLFLLDAFAQLAVPELRLLIVGDGPMRGPIEAKIAELQLGSRVILAGQQTEPERWMQAIDIFCLPSYANEGVPQAIVQAMLCAKAIVATPVGAILEAVSHEESALVVPPQDAAALATAIRRLLDDPALAERLGVSARRRASADFSLDVMLNAMEELFRRHSDESRRSLSAN